MPAVRTLVAPLVPAALAVAILLALRPAPALACSCGYGDAAEMAAYADTVFLGKVVGAITDGPELQAAFDAFTGGPIEDTPLGRRSWVGLITTTFAVETVYKGAVAAEAVVLSHADDGTCGTFFGPTMRYVVYARYAARLWTGGSMAAHKLREFVPGAALLTTLCDGSFVYFGDEALARAAVLGEGRPPVSASAATAAAEATVVVEATGAAADVTAAASDARGAPAEAIAAPPTSLAASPSPSADEGATREWPLTTVLAALAVFTAIVGGALWSVRPRRR